MHVVKISVLSQDVTRFSETFDISRTFKRSFEGFNFTLLPGLSFALGYFFFFFPSKVQILLRIMSYNTKAIRVVITVFANC